MIDVQRLNIPNVSVVSRAPHSHIITSRPPPHQHPRAQLVGVGSDRRVAFARDRAAAAGNASGSDQRGQPDEHLLLLPPRSRDAGAVASGHRDDVDSRDQLLRKGRDRSVSADRACRGPQRICAGALGSFGTRRSWLSAWQPRWRHRSPVEAPMRSCRCS